jgi:ubiquinone/menaquinone biosynthesis C-methylase UbiE
MTHAQDWDDLGHVDPLWAIITVADRRFGRWDLDEFMRTGDREIAGLMAEIESLGFPRQRGRALDFGCGIGRLTRALARQFSACVGVDVAPAMLEMARKVNSDLPHCNFLLNRSPNLALFGDETFDLVYTNMVLQHLPEPSLIEGLIAEFCRIVKPGGLIAMQIPHSLPLKFRIQPGRRLYAVLRKFGVGRRFLYDQLTLTPMRLISLSESRVFGALESGGARILRVQPDDHCGPEIQSRMYFVTK